MVGFNLLYGLNDMSLKLVDKSTYLSCNISSTESNVNLRIGKTWTTMFDLVWFLPSCGCVSNIWLRKMFGEKSCGDYTRMLYAV